MEARCLLPLAAGTSPSTPVMNNRLCNKVHQEDKKLLLGSKTAAALLSPPNRLDGESLPLSMMLDKPLADADSIVASSSTDMSITAIFLLVVAIGSDRPLFTHQHAQASRTLRTTQHSTRTTSLLPPTTVLLNSSYT